MNSNELKIKSTGKCCNAVATDNSFELMMKRHSSKPLNLVAESKLTYPGREMVLSGTVQERAAKEYHQTLNVQLQKYQNIQVNSVYKMEPRHELTTDIIIPDTPKITIKGHLQPDLMNLQAHGEVTYASQTYLADTNWEHNGNRKNFNTKADMMVSYPKRSITAYGTARRQGSEIISTFETKWDAINNENKKFTLSSKVNIEPTTPAIELVINVYPQHVINLNINGNYATEGWYKSTSDLKGDLSLKTSFENFEDINAAFLHDRTPKVFKNSAEFSWKRNQKISGFVNIKKIRSWANANIKAEVTTPFRGARSLSTDVSYNLQDTTFSTKVEVDVEDTHVVLGYNGELNIPQHTLNSELTFTSPFRQFESITASARYNDNGQNYQSNAVISWAPSKQINIDFTMQHQGNNAAATNNGEVSISTPISGFQQCKITWQHEHNANKITNVGQIEHEGISIYNHNAVINIKNTNKKLVFDVQASMKAYKLEEIAVTIDHTNSHQKLDTIKTDWSITWAPSKTITVSYDMDMSGDKIMQTKAKFMSPFKGFESLNLKSNTNKDSQSGKIVSSNEFEWSQNKKINLNGDVTITGYALQGSVSLTTPFDQAKSIVMNARNRQHHGIWVSHVDLDYGKQVIIDTEFRTGMNKMLSVSLVSPCPHLRNVYTKAELKGDIRNFDCSLEMNHNKLPDRIIWTATATTADVNNIKVSTELMTPFKEMSTLKAEMNYKKEGNTIHVDGMVEHPQYKGTLTEDIIYRPGRFINTNTIVEYIEGKKLELMTELKVDPKVSGKILWKSPFEKLEEINLKFDHDGSLHSFTTTGELSYSPSDKITANMNINMNGNTLNGRAQLATPFNKAKHMIVVINHDGPVTGFKNDASFELNSERLSGKSEFNLNGDNMNLKAEVQTPVEGYETATMEITHSGPITNFNNNAILTLGNQQLSGSSKLRIRRSALTGSLDLQMPFTSFNNLDINVDHSGSWSDMNNKIIVVYNTQKCTAKTSYKLSGNTFNGKIVVKTPFEEARSINVEVSHEGPASNFKNSGVVSWNANDVNANSEFMLSGDNVALKGSITLPIKKLKTMSMDVTHQGPVSNFNNNVILTYNNKKVTGSSQFSLAGSSVTAKANLNMPKIIAVAEFSHTGVATNFNNNGLLRYNDNRISADSQFKLRGNKLVSNVNIASPWAALSGEVNHNGPANSFANNAVVKYNEHEATAGSEFSMNGNTLSAKANFACPGSKLSGEISHNGPINNFQNNGVVKYNDHEATGGSEFNLNADSMSAKARFICPGSRMSGEVNHNGPATAFSNNALFKYNRKQVSGSTEFNLNGDTLLAKADLEIPESTASIALNHNGQINNFKNDATVIVNGDSYRVESQFSKSGNKIKGKASSTYPSGTTSGEFNHRGKVSNFNNDMTLIHSDKRVTGSSKFKLTGNTMAAEGDFVMPDKTMSFDVSHEGPVNSFKNNIKLQCDGKNIIGSSEFTLSGNSMMLKSSIKSPFDSLRTMSAEINHAGPASNFNNNAVFIYNDKQVTGSSQFSYSGNKLTTKCNFEMPAFSLTGEINHNGKLTNFKNDASLSYNGQPMSGDSEFRLRGDSLSAKGGVSTPSNTLTAEVTHNGPITNFNNNGLVTFNGKRMSGSSMFNLRSDALKGKATLQIPSKNMEIEVNHNGPASNFVSDAKMTYNGKEAAGNLQFSLQGNTLHSKVTINTPVTSLSIISLEINHDGPIDNFKNDISLIYGQDQVSGSSQFKLRNDILKAKTELSLPIEALRNIAIEVTHNGPATNFENNIKVTIDSDSISGASQFSLDGNTMTAKANLQTTYNMSPVTFEIYHSGPEHAFTNNAVFTYGRKQVSGSSEFTLEGENLNLKANLETSFCCMEPLSLEITHRGPADNFVNSGIAKYGSYEVSADSEFNLRSNGIHLKSGMRTNIGGLKPVSLEVNHEGPLTAFNNNALISYGDDNVGGESEFSLHGTNMHIKVTAQTTFGQIKPMSIEVNHNGPIEKFENDLSMTYGNKEISSTIRFSIDGNTISGDIKLQTPFKPVAKMMAKFNHKAKNLRNFANSATMKLNNEKYTGKSELKWFGKVFKLFAEVNIPDEYSIKVNHKGFSKDFSNNMKIKIPGDKISGTSSFKIDGNKVNGKASIDSTIKSISSIDLALAHEGDFKKFDSSFDIKTPVKGYKTFSGELNHEGGRSKFQTTGKLNLPFKSLKMLTATANHESDIGSFNTGAAVSYDDKTFSGALNGGKTARKVNVDASFQTPYAGYENFGASMEHTGDRDNFQTTGAFTSSMPGYERFSGSLSHNGNQNNFKTTGQVTTPISDYSNFGFDVEHNGNLRNFKTSGVVTTSIPNYERFGGNAEYSYDGTTLHAAGSAQTPFRGYDEFGLNLDHTGTMKNFQTSAGVTTPIRSYKNFGASINHNGDLNNFHTAVEATSSMPGYDKFSASLDKKGSLRDFEVSSNVKTPFRRYENFGASMKHSGEPLNFRTTGVVTTSIPGYDRFSGSLNHEGNWRQFSTNAEIQTPIRSHETYTMNVNHNSNNGITTTGSFEYPGKKYDFNLKHRGTIKHFNSEIQVNTPHSGYDNFGLTIAHNGDIGEFTQSGTIHLPFSQLPEIKYSISHKGNLNDFACSATVEYTQHKIEVSGNFQKTSSWSEGTYEGGFSATTTYPSLREFQMHGTHNRKSTQKSGMLDVTYNGQKTVDLDYDYTTSGQKTINIKVRHPQPLETTINFNGNGAQFSGDAFLNWQDMFTASGEFSLKNQENEREVNLKVVLPSRTVALKSGYSLTGTSFKHNTDLQWGNGAARKLSYTLDASKTNRRSQNIIDGRFNIESAQLSGEMTVNHVCVPGRQYTSEIALQTSKRMSIKSDLSIDTPRFQHTLTIEHPEIKKVTFLYSMYIYRINK